MIQLTTPIKINNLELKNRLVMPPMATAKSDQFGKVSSDLIKYYAEKSRDRSIGLIITEHSYISPEGKATQGQLSIAHDTDIEGLRQLVDCIHANETKVIAQINHAGGAAKTKITEQEVLAPSVLINPRFKDESELPRAMLISDIKKVISDFAAAALRAKEAGFDGVEIHSAHGYLLNQFYSPLLNQRNDQYNGQTLAGRIKLHLQVIAAVREAVGEDYPIALRLGASDYMPGGTTIEDSILAAQSFEKAGVDLLDISGGICGYNVPDLHGQGFFSDLTEKIKAYISVPVLLTGGITDGFAANDLISSGRADLVGVGRAILKDSAWAKKAIEAIVDFLG